MNPACWIEGKTYLNSALAATWWNTRLAPEPEFVLITDNDGHWYVVADNDTAAFFAQVNDPLGDPESIADRVGGAPSLVKFKQYRIE